MSNDRTAIAGERPALLLAGDGRPLSPADIELSEFVLEEEELERLRRSARRRGRVLEREHRCVLGIGLAARLVLPEGSGAPGAAEAASALLAALGDGRAVAMGALPFDPETPGELVVPEVLAMASEDRARVIIGGPAETARARLDALLDETEPPAGELPDRFDLVSSKSHREFRALVADGVAAVVAGELDKVVLAREVVVSANRDFQQSDLVARLRALHPSCLSFAVDGFVGASPELLCRRHGGEVFSEPLAGTVARSGDPESDRKLAEALFSSPKERREHALVVEAITAVLEAHGVEVTTPEVPQLLELRNVAHLATPIHGTARRQSVPSALRLACALHPTPAVGGYPKAAALSYLAKHEGLERGRYAGAVGFLEASGDGEFWIGIRSAEVHGRRARLMAGVGIVEGSNPAAELAETQLKLQALLAVAVRP